MSRQQTCNWCGGDAVIAVPVANDVRLCEVCGEKYMARFRHYAKQLAHVILLNPNYDGDDPQFRRFSQIEID